MKLLNLAILCSALIIYRLSFIIASPEESNYRYQNVKYFADPDHRLQSQYYHYSNTEFDHSLDDSRCRRNSRINIRDSRPIVKETQYGNIQGRRVYLCDHPGLSLRYRPGQPLAPDAQLSVKVFLGIPYAEPPVRRRNGDNLQFKVSL